MTRIFQIFALQILIGFLSSSNWSCAGQDGEGDRNEGAVPDSSERELTAPCASIRGKIEWVDGAGSNNGTEIWLVDHLNGSVTIRAVQSDGSYKLECGIFPENNILSLHLVRGQRLIGDFDFAPAEDGVQGAFSYAGGLGFDQGTIKIARINARDDSIVAGIPAKVGGGFRVLTEHKVSLNSLGSRLWPVSVLFASHLKTISPFSILYSFYLGFQKPHLYQRDLASFSRVEFSVSSSESKFVRRVKISADKGWLKYARSVSDTDDTPGTSYWSEREFEVGDESSIDLYRIGVFPGIAPKRGYIALFQIFKGSGSILTVPRFLDEVVAFPPKIISFGTGLGSSVATIDYGDEVGSNGLTRPFCENGAVRLVVEPPRNGLPESQESSFVAEGEKSQVEVRIDYFGDGQTNDVALVPLPADFYGVYSKEDTRNVGANLQSAWDPMGRIMVFTSKVGLFGAQKIQLPGEVLLSAISGKSVNFIRLRIDWTNQSRGTTGGTVVWLRKRCSL
jgi:hypothetical protein